MNSMSSSLSGSRETATTTPITTKIITIADLNNLKKDRTILIAGFPGPGLVGSISTSYIIDKLEMYQIAFVESHYISPGVIFIDGKLRHPFRLYANKEGNVCVLVCEAPIMMDGIHFVLDAVMDWAMKNSIEEVMVLDGIPVQGIPDSDRKTVVLASENMEKTTNKEIKVTDEVNKEKGGETEFASNEGANPQSNFNRSAIEDSTKKYTTFIGGIAGGLLSACLSNQIPCAAILIPSSSGIPDPEGASLLIESFNNFINDNNLKIETSQLREQGQKLKKQLEQIIKAEQEQRAAGGGGAGAENGNVPSHRLMYG